MTTELTYLALVTVFTAVMWGPYTLNMIITRGLIDAVGYPEDPKPVALWATRMKAAHSNAIENLVVFGVLVLIAHLAGINNDTTALICVIYFWTRVIHLLSYTLGIPVVRTLAFAVGFGCQIALAFQVLM